MVAQADVSAPSLTEITADGTMRLHPHPGQWEAWQSRKRFVVVLAGTQGGKTSFGPHWLLREIKERGPGDYMVVTPTFPLLEVKALPEFLRVFRDQLDLGAYQSSPVRCFTLSADGEWRLFGAVQDLPTRVLFGYAADPDSLESATLKAVWLDEAGQRKFKLGSWEAIQRRLSLAQGRALVTTTPYDLGWLKLKFYDPWQAAGRDHPEIDLIRFDSTENPTFPQAEFDRARRELPAWKFDLFYRAIFTRPAGLIYDAFDPERHVVPPFPIPDDWPRYLGLDFGGVNTAGVFYAEELTAHRQPTGRLILYREYKAGGRTAAGHAMALRAGEPAKLFAVGGSKSEGQWRDEFKAGGLRVHEPKIVDVEVGIDRVYGCHTRDEIIVFSTCGGYLEQKQTYSRALDERGEPTEAIEDKHSFHYLDGERYIIGWLRHVGASKRPHGYQ